MSTSYRQSGFTLLEILVVVFIIAVLTGTAMLSLGVLDDDRDVQREADKAAALFAIALDDAMLQGREFGIEFTRAGYRFVEYDILGDRWAEVPLDDLLQTHVLPEDIEFELYVDEQRIELNQTPANFVLDDDEDDGRAFGIEQYAPHVYVYSSGDMTPFELHFVRYTDNARVAFRIDILGNTEFIEDDEFYP